MNMVRGSGHSHRSVGAERGTCRGRPVRPLNPSGLGESQVPAPEGPGAGGPRAWDGTAPAETLVAIRRPHDFPVGIGDGIARSGSRGRLPTTPFDGRSEGNEGSTAELYGGPATGGPGLPLERRGRLAIRPTDGPGRRAVAFGRPAGVSWSARRPRTAHELLSPARGETTSGPRVPERAARRDGRSTGPP